MKVLKKLSHKIVGVLMSLLMVFSCVNTSAFQVFAQNDVTLGAQGTSDKEQEITVPEIWGTENVKGYDVNIDNSKAFSLDLTGSVDDNLYMDRSEFENDSGNIKKALNWYYTNPSDANFWLVQTVIWGISSGAVTNFTSEDVLSEVQIVYAQAGYQFDRDTVADKLYEIENTGTSGTYYIYSYDNSHSRLVTNASGSVPTANYSTVSSTQTADRTEKVLVTINKTDADSNNGLSGITFDLYKDNEFETTVTTDDAGKAEYTFTETISSTKTVTYEYCLNYSILSPGNKTLATANGQYASAESAQSAADVEAMKQATDEINASNSGQHTYKAIETATKEEYYLNPNDAVFEQNATGTYNPKWNDATVTFNVFNIRQKGIINITKVDTDKGSGVEGAVYGLYASENIINPDGSNQIMYTKGQLVSQFPATDKNGHSTLSDLYLGNYYVQEITAPDGYLLSDAQFSVSLEYAGSGEDHVTASISCNDEWQPGEINVTKTDDETGTPLAGAIFELYAKKDITHPDGSGEVLYEAGEKVASFPATDENGETSLTGLYLGEYEVRELQTPQYYFADTTGKEVTLSYKGQTADISVINLPVENHRQEGKITITQRDSETMNTVPGAVYELYAAETIYHPDGVTGALYSAGDLVATSDETDTNGQTSFDNLYLGKYYILLKTAPEGYVWNENRQDIEISYLGQDVEVNSIMIDKANAVQRGTISIKKEDNETGTAQADATLEGATYGLYARHDIEHKDTKTGVIKYGQEEIELLKGTDLVVMDVKATDDTLIAIAKTDANGEISFGNLYLGDYFIKEIEPSEGYNLDETEYDITLAYAGQDVEVTSADTKVYENVIKRAFDISKIGQVENVNGTSVPLSGVHFEVKLESEIQALVNSGLTLDEAKAQATLVDELVTGADGMASSIELPYGTYRVIETVPATDYVAADDFFVTIDTESREHIDLTNSPVINNLFFAKVVPIKLDAETGKTVKIADTEFKIKALTDCYINGRKISAGEYVGYYEWTNNDSKWIDSWKSDENGEIAMRYMLSAGVYSLEEINAPYGYVLNSQPVEFTVTTNTVYELNEDSQPVFNIYFEDQPVKGKIVANTHGEVLTGFDEGKFIYEDIKLSDAEFKLTTKEDIMDPSNDGTVIYPKGTVIDVLATDENGNVTFDNLPLGQYTLTQTKAQHGYIVDNEEYDINIEYYDQNTPEIDIALNIENERQHYIATVEKLDSESNDRVPGAVIYLETIKDIYNYDGKLIASAGSTVITNQVTGEDGTFIVDADLPFDCKFEFYEHSAPDGYVNNYEHIAYNTAYTGQDEEFVKDTITFVNDPTTIHITKLSDDSGIAIKGAQLQLVDSQGNIVDEWITDGQPHEIKRLTVGEEYTIVEVLAADGFLKADDVKFTVENTAEVQSFVMRDELAKGQITVIKSGEVLTGFEDGQFVYEEQGLAGAVFEIYAKNDVKNPDGVSDNFYDAGELVATLTTGEDGKAITDLLPLGEYTVKETKAPYGYVIDSSNADVELAYADQNTPVVFASSDKYNARQTITLDISKVDKDSQTALKGAEFTIFANDDVTDVNGNVIIEKGEAVAVAVSDENGKVVFNIDLPVDMRTEKTADETVEAGPVYGSPDSLFVIKETGRPVGYASSNAIVYVDTSYTGQENDTNILAYNLENEMTRTQFTLSDVDTGNLVSNVQLSLIPVNEDGTLDEGAVFETWITGNEPYVIRGIEPGKYVVRMTLGNALTNGYVTSNDFEFEVKDTADMQYADMTIDHTHTSFELTDEFDNRLNDAIMSIVPLDENGDPMYGKTFDTWQTELKDGHEVEYLPIGKYLLVQNTSADVTVKAEPVEFEVTDTAEQQAYGMVNKYAVFDLTDLEGTHLDDADMTVYDSDGTVVDEFDTSFMTIDEDIIAVVESEGKYAMADSSISDDGKVEGRSVYVTKAGDEYRIYATFTSGTIDETKSETRVFFMDAEGNTKIAVKGLSENSSYVMEETNAPEEYVASINTEMNITTDKDTQSFTMSNKQFTVNKVDENGDLLAGAELEIRDTEGNVINSWTSDSESGHITSGLRENESYVLVEVVPPYAYETAEELNFNIDDVKEDQEITLANELILTDVTVTLTDKETGQPITGKDFVFGIYSDKECTDLIQEVYSDTATGTVTFTDLPYGTYYIKQLSAPEGYYINDEVFEIVIDENFQGVGDIHNMAIEVAPVPVDTGVRTGDNADLAGLALLMVGACAGAYISRKRKHTA